ncbi:MAG: membrane protein insertion efficiency factor YidD [Desulfovibrio sp.]|jgi:putative membrane protein insertion efficiency factor|nr:membrane protein insertion efficiency factor YidD [Desulfovibrio sp.]
MDRAGFIRMAASAASAVILSPIRLYRLFVSPLLPPCCRFYPSCSEYAEEAVLRHGPVRGGMLAAWRILRCSPLAKGGYDPVPPNPQQLMQK